MNFAFIGAVCQKNILIGISRKLVTTFDTFNRQRNFYLAKAEPCRRPVHDVIEWYTWFMTFTIICYWQWFAITRWASVKMNEVKKIWREADAVMFDVDSTVVKEEGIDRLAEFCGKGPEVAKITSDAMNKGLDFREALRLRLNIMNPSLKQLEDYIRLHPTTLTPEVQELIELLKSKNVAVYLVSGGLRRIIEPTRVLLNIPEENVFANRLLFENGKYAGFDLNEPTSKNRGKSEVAALLKNKFGYKRLVMIGDGSIDADASPPADAFIGFGGNIIRENVRAKAKWFVTSFRELIDELN